MREAVTVRLVGGLGNQLFGYYAGAALASRRGVPLRLDVSHARYGVTDHGLEIRKFDLPGQWLGNESAPTVLGRISRLPARGLARAARTLPTLGYTLRIYESKNVGHDPAVLEQRAGSQIRGYFQSWSIVSEAVRAGYPRRPRLRRSTGWLQRITEQAAFEQPVAVHVRRGDYMNMTGFGLLGPSYYEPAIARVRESGINGPIWLFSDDMASARKALGMWGRGAVGISASAGPAAELIAMSHARAHVIANSTFGWWGAWMNDSADIVIAPQPWFESGEDVAGLIPPDWRLMPARFSG